MVQAWQTCHLLEPAHSDPYFLGVDLATGGFVFLFFLSVFVADRDIILGFSALRVLPVKTPL